MDLPDHAESTTLIKAILAGIAARWTDKRVKIDRSVFNAGRICRLLATKNRKGDSTEQRPHRFCQKLRVPDFLANGWAHPIPEDKLRLVAALVPANEASNKKRASQSLINASSTDNHAGNGSHRLNVENWLTDRGIEFQPAKTLADGRTCWPIVCPFNPDHGFDANITRDADGTLGAGCFHDECAGNHWQKFKEQIGPPNADHYDTPQPADDRPPIVIDPDEHQVIDATVAALRAVASLYQRHGVLVGITRPDNIPDGAIHSVVPPSIEVVPPATLRELITRCGRGNADSAESVHGRSPKK